MSLYLNQNKIKHAHISGRSIKKGYLGSRLVFTAENPPDIFAFPINPGTIDLDARSTGNIVLSYVTRNKAPLEATPTTNTIHLNSQNIPVIKYLIADSRIDIPLTEFPANRFLGACSDGADIYMLDYTNNFARAWNIASRTRNGTKDIDLSRATGETSQAWRGGVFVNRQFYFINGPTAYGFDTSGNPLREQLNIALGAGNYERSFTDGTTIWFIEQTTNAARAFNAVRRQRDSNKDFNLGGGAWYGAGDTTRGLYLLNANAVPPVIHCYTKQDRQRRSAKDITLSNTTFWRGLVAANEIVYAHDTTNRKLEAYRLMETRYHNNIRYPQKDFDLGTGTWQGAASDGTNVWIINTTNNKAVAWTAPTLTTPAVRTESLDFDLLGGGVLKGLVYADGRIWAIDDSTLARCYEPLAGIRDETRDITHGYTDVVRGVSDGVHIWFVRGNTNAEAFLLSDRTPQSSHLISLGRGNWEGGAFWTGESLYFVNRNAVPPAIQARSPAGATQTGKNFTIPAGQYRGAFAINKLAFFIDHENNRAISYYLDSHFGQQTIPQPSSSASYILTAGNDTGSVSLSSAVEVTQNPVITNFRRVSFQQAPGLQAGTFGFRATIVGYPQPALSYRFGNGRQGAITSRHLSPSGGTNEFNFNWSIYHTILNDSLVLTAQNSSGSVSSTISRISN